MGGHKPKKIQGDHRVWLLARAREKDFTLRGLVSELSERGLEVDYRSVWNFVQTEKLSFKKCMARPRSTSVILDLAHWQSAAMYPACCSERLPWP
jgi:putative transposase